MDEEEKQKREELKAKRKAMREEALDQMFGKNRKEPVGNIWGWKFSLVGLAFLFTISSIVGYGLYTGKIDIDKEMSKDNRHPFFPSDTSAKKKPK